MKRKKQIKCNNCNTWNENKNYYCVQCGHIIKDEDQGIPLHQQFHLIRGIIYASGIIEIIAVLILITDFLLFDNFSWAVICMMSAAILSYILVLYAGRKIKKTENPERTIIKSKLQNDMIARFIIKETGKSNLISFSYADYSYIYEKREAQRQYQEMNQLYESMTRQSELLSRQENER